MLNNRIIDKEIGNKIYKCIVIDYRDEQGKKKQKFKNTKVTVNEYLRGKKKVVEQMRTSFVSEFQKELEKKQGRKFEYDNITVKDMLIIYANSKKGKVTDIVYQGYFAMIKKMENFLKGRKQENIKLKNFTAEMLKEFYSYCSFQKNRSGEQITNNTMKHIIAFYNPAFKLAYENDYIDKDITKGIHSPKVTRVEQIYLNADEIKEFMEAVNESELGFVLKFGLLYGLRRSELLGLTWDDIDFENERIYVNKTVHYHKGEYIISKQMKTETSKRELPFYGNIKQLLLEQKEKAERNKKWWGKDYCSKDKRFKNFVCVDNLGNIFCPDRLSREVKRICKKHNLPDIHFHSLRHSCASLFVVSGVDMKTIQMWLGHSNYSTTADIYSHIDLNSKRQAVMKVDKYVFGSDEKS